MGAELRIESEELVRLAEELASLRQMSVADAVTEAVRQRIRHERAVQAKAERMLDAAQAFWTTLPEPKPSSDHSWLYDESGLPA